MSFWEIFIIALAFSSILGFGFMLGVASFAGFNQILNNIEKTIMKKLKSKRK